MKFNLNFAKIKKLRLNGVRFIYKLLVTLAKRFVLTFFLLLIIVAILSLLVFYKYVILSETIDSVSELVPPKSIFKEELYQKILKTWEEQEGLFEETDSKEYINPFKIKILLSPEQEPKKP